ncbi:MAG: DJ-1 family protein, partial [Spirochaetae bacterium HGW-Spirochaetae-8]
NCPGYSFSDERVCVDGNLITSRAAGCAVEFALMLVEKLVGMDERNAIAKSILFNG